MKKIKTYLVVFACLIGSVLVAQSNDSYGKMQKRFTSNKLSAEDSLAFKEAGVLKAQTLFEYGDVYISNSSNMSNQAYVVDRVPDLFYASEGESLNTDSIFLMVNEIIENEKPNAIEIEFSEKEGVLGHVATATKKLKFEADIIIVKAPKQFGNKKEKVWQVFLANPKFIDGPTE